jgi:hypothetical protein
MVLEATRVTPLNAMFKIYPREKTFTVQIAKCAQTLIEVPPIPRTKARPYFGSTSQSFGTTCPYLPLPNLYRSR